MSDTLLDDARALREARAEIQRLEARQEELNERLLAAERGKSAFISNALNELQNPLAAVVGLTDQMLAMREPAWDQVRESLRWVRDEGAYLEFQLRNLFMASELEAGIARCNPRRCDPCALFNRSLTRALPLAQSRQVSLQVNGGGGQMSALGAPPPMAIDATLLALIVGNLLTNGIKASPPGAAVLMQVDVLGTQLHVQVRDHGDGLSAQAQARMYDRFWQLDGSTTRRNPGLGLGLAVSAGCAELMGGRLTHQVPDDGPGAVFVLSVPLSQSAVVAQAGEDELLFFDLADDEGDEPSERL